MVRLALAQKISWGTSEFVEWAACEILSRSETVLSGDVPSNCSLASFRHARFFDFFNEIGPKPEAVDLRRELLLSAENRHPAELHRTAQVDPLSAVRSRGWRWWPMPPCRP